MTDSEFEELSEAFPIITYATSGPISQRNGIALLDADSTLLMTLADPPAIETTNGYLSEDELVIVNKTATPHVIYNPDRGIMQIPGKVGAGIHLYATSNGTWAYDTIENAQIG